MLRLKQFYFSEHVFFYLMCSAFILLVPTLLLGQEKQMGRVEFGLDILPYTSQIDKDEPESKFDHDWEFYFKSQMKKAEFRIKVGHYNDPIHKKKLLKIVEVTDQCVDETAYKSYNRPKGFYFFNMGYAVKKSLKYFSLVSGVDCSLSYYKDQTIVYNVFCVAVVNNQNVGGETLYRFISKTHYFSAGFQPFVGIKVPFLNRFNFTLETGLRFNYVFGNRVYWDKFDFPAEEPFHETEINWGKLTNDIGISYSF